MGLKVAIGGARNRVNILRRNLILTVKPLPDSPLCDAARIRQFFLAAVLRNGEPNDFVHRFNYLSNCRNANHNALSIGFSTPRHEEVQREK